ncbi:hypothetical protein OWR29_00365 [Actinoplanes sp. Pm04-4]|uniref:Uncharacterized protein n=1 Tax=Paractinoplanes pyxinae TaxID=2997416 RepID=A0ABT4AQA4_9ACTN|nr:hypothetical protein [Actinoplanes pyxinae]MCY1136432.1 hypothetical protein [Actinoplanes pyxinae]
MATEEKAQGPKEVRDLRREIRFVGNSSASFERRIIEDISAYDEYLRRIGMIIGEQGPSVRVDNSAEVPYYDPARQEVLISEKHAEDTTFILVLFTHPLLMSYAGRDQSQLTAAGRAVEWALAFYLACSFRDNPRTGRVDLSSGGSLQSASSIDEIGEAWGSAFWHMRTN